MGRGRPAASMVWIYSGSKWIEWDSMEMLSFAWMDGLNE
jgi:hypothetical protein